MKGDLKIIKSSSDGKLEGFSFKVEGPDGYNETFTTDAMGEIHVMGLRIGSYTISEVEDKASAGYTLPKPVEITIKTGETATVKMHNEKKPDTPASSTPSQPDTPSTPKQPGKTVPQTGDDGRLLVLLAIFGLAVLGGCITIVVYRRKNGRKPPLPPLPDLTKIRK